MKKIIIISIAAISLLTVTGFVYGAGLKFSTFVGSSDTDEGMALGVYEQTGEVYVTGRTSCIDFPITPGAYDSTLNGRDDAFIIKLSHDGSALLYSTYIGGIGLDDQGEAIEVNDDGEAIVVGTLRDSTDFPVTPGSYSDTHTLIGTDERFWVLKLSYDGSTLIFSTLLGGSKYQRLSDVAIDPDENVYVCGQTMSLDYPTTPGAFQPVYNGGFGDGCVTKLSADGSSLLYSTYLGTSDSDVVFDITVDKLGNAYVTGDTGSGFPVTPGAFDTSYNGGTDIFVSKLNADGTALIFSTYLGGSNTERSDCIIVDTLYDIYVSGKTMSGDFPVTPGAFDTTLSRYSYDAFVTKLNHDGSALVYSTYLGGNSEEEGLKIIVDNALNAYIAGNTASPDFPVTPDAFDTTYNGATDVFISKLNVAGSKLVYSTFIGGSAGESIRWNGFHIDRVNNVFLTGWTKSADFPVTYRAYDTTYNGNSDIFVLNLELPFTVIPSLVQTCKFLLVIILSFVLLLMKTRPY